jgi:hypothetical protein
MPNACSLISRRKISLDCDDNGDSEILSTSTPPNAVYTLCNRAVIMKGKRLSIDDDDDDDGNADGERRRYEKSVDGEREGGSDGDFDFDLDFERDFDRRDELELV